MEEFLIREIFGEALNIQDGDQKPSHPTGSLDFLKKLRESQHGNVDVKAKVKLRIIVVGAGLCGLSTGLALARSGHSVTIYEEAPVLAEVGAGIQVAPNSSRHLLRWGVDKYLEGLTVEPEALITRRWENGKAIGNLQFQPLMRETYGAPFYQIHRADYHYALQQAALEHGAQIKLASKVEHFDFNKTSITLESGEVFEGDLIVAADGVESTARAQFQGEEPTPSQVTGYAAYRGTLDAEVVKNVPELKWLVEKPVQNCWLGGYRHIITYTMKGGRLFNFVLLHPESRDVSRWENDNFSELMMEHYRGWDSSVLKLISLIENPTKWPILMTSPMKKWATENGNFLIIGDAAHAMVPWMGQGAAMAIEDAAALEELLRRLPSKSALPKAMQVYQSVRIPRTQKMQDASLLNGYLLHLPDGPEQRARDEASRNEVEGKPFITSSNQWSDPSTQRWAYGHDACEEMRTAWQQLDSNRTLCKI